MYFKSFIARAMLAAACFVAVALPSQAAVNSQNLGAKYDGTAANITFRVYSSRATRIELDLFSAGYGVAEKLKYVLALDPNTPNVWQVTVPVTTIKNAGMTGSVYYGYRAWGPRWTYSTSWTKGSSVGFVS